MLIQVRQHAETIYYCLKSWDFSIVNKNNPEIEEIPYPPSFLSLLPIVCVQAY